MEANTATINSFINSQALVEIPFFQRPYVWGEDLWSRLLEDISYVASNKNIFHFFGSVILKQIPEDRLSSSFGNKHNVKILVDGQQRVTTLMILLKVIALKFNKGDLFDDKFYDMDNNLLLAHGQNDKEAFEKVMRLTEPVELDNSENSRVIGAYNYFLKNMDSSGIKIDNGRHFTYVIDHIQFVCIALSPNENEQQIFDTLNSLGVNLTTSELLKNYLFNQDTIELYKSKWVNVFEKDSDTKDYWFGLVEQGSVKRAMIDIFFESYFKLFVQSNMYVISQEDKIKYDRSENLSLSIQNFISKYCNGDKNVILESMNEYADCFRKCFQPDQCKGSISDDSALERLNIVMFGLGHTTLIPYVLFVAKNVEDAKERDKIYRILESLIMRRLITKSPTNVYPKLFTSLILNKTIDAASLAERLNSGVADAFSPRDESLKTGIHEFKRTNLQSRGILYLIETTLRGRQSIPTATQMLGFNSYSLEHLMPKKWRNNWSKCDSPEAEANRDKTLLTLGNLAIIPQALNSSIRDSNWTTKKDGNGKKPGLSLCAAGLLTLADVLDKDEWNEEEIVKRSDKLYELATEIWKI